MVRKTSVLMTVHDREAEVLLSTLRGLWRSGLGDAELVIVNDRSTLDYSWIKAYAQPRFAAVKWADAGEYDGFRIDGYGNPARAFNTGLQIVTGERLVVMSSDVIVTPRVVKSLDRYWTPEWLYTPQIINLDDGNEYCGVRRPFPMPWFLAMPAATALAVGGWDDAFMGGLCFEDNDFVGRMALSLSGVRCDWSVAAWHQSHVQPAYDQTLEGVLEANARNRDICKRKWGGVPFDSEQPCWTMVSKPDPSGCTKLEFSGADTLKERILGQKA